MENVEVATTSTHESQATVLTIEKGADVTTATIAAPKAEANVAGKVENVTVTSDATDKAKLDIKADAVVSTAKVEAANAETTVAANNVTVEVTGTNNTVTVSGANATTSIASTATGAKVEVSGADSKTSIDATGATVEVKEGATGTKVEATSTASTVTINSASETVAKEVTVNVPSKGNVTGTNSDKVTVKESVKVTFDANGGNALVPAYMMVEKHVDASQGVDAVAGGTINPLPTATRLGYADSNAWNTQADGKGTALATTTTFTADVTYYAQWGAPIEYTITYNLDGGKLAEQDTNPTTYNVETADFTLKAPAKVGYTFAGWYMDGKLLADSKIVKGTTGNLSLTAKWTVIEYEIKYELNGGVNNAANPAKYTVEKVVTFAAPTKEGYTFVAWSTDAEGKNVITSTKDLTDTLTVYAIWEKNTESIVGSAITYIATGLPNWTGMPTADDMKLTYTLSGTTISATGNLPYVDGFEGFNTSDKTEQSGHYATVMIPVAADDYTAATAAVGTVITLTGSKEKTYTKDTLSAIIDGTENHYIALLLRVDTKKPFTLTVDWDGDGKSYSATTYTIDFSKVVLDEKITDRTSEFKPATLHDTRTEGAIADADLYEANSYKVTLATQVGDTTTVKLAATNLQKHQNGDDPTKMGYWVGAFLPAPKGTEWSKVQYSTDNKTWKGGLTAADTTESEVEYLSYYVDAGVTGKTFDFYVKWSENAVAEHFILDTSAVKIITPEEVLAKKFKDNIDVPTGAEVTAVTATTADGVTTYNVTLGGTVDTKAMPTIGGSTFDSIFGTTIKEDADQYAAINLKNLFVDDEGYTVKQTNGAFAIYGAKDIEKNLTVDGDNSFKVKAGYTAAKDNGEYAVLIQNGKTVTIEIYKGSHVDISGEKYTLANTATSSNQVVEIVITVGTTINAKTPA